MDLEQRVTMLEQEIQILKNQIQATLLDIQEHLLANAYPSLRADDDSPRPATPAVKSISAKPDAPPTLPVGLPSPAASEAHATLPASVPDVRPLPHLTNSVGRGEKVAPFVVDDDFPTGTPEGAPIDKPVTRADWALMEQLVDWTNRRVSRFGARHTRALIHRYTAEGRISPGVRDALLQIVAIGVVPVDASGTPVTITPTPALLNRPEPDELPGDDPNGHVSSNLILRLIAGITTAGNARSRSTKRHG